MAADVVERIDLAFLVTHDDGTVPEAVFEDEEIARLRNSIDVVGQEPGVLGDEPLVFRVAFKPTSSIQQKQETVDLDGRKVVFDLGKEARHDPCVAVRAVPCVPDW